MSKFREKLSKLSSFIDSTFIHVAIEKTLSTRYLKNHLSLDSDILHLA